MSQVTTIMILFIALELADGSNKFDSEMMKGLRKLSFVLTISAIILFGVFFKTINKGYMHTFLSIETGGQQAIRAFRAHEDDALKIDAVFFNNKNMWKSIEKEVEDWVHQNWERWMEEKPAWFNETVRSKFPEDMIPTMEGKKKMRLERAKRAIEKRRKRKSVVSIPYFVMKRFRTFLRTDRNARKVKPLQEG